MTDSIHFQFNFNSEKKFREPTGWQLNKVIDLNWALITWLGHLREAGVQVMALTLPRQNKSHGKERFTADLQRRSDSRQRQFLHGEDVHQQNLNPNNTQMIK